MLSRKKKGKKKGCILEFSAVASGTEAEHRLAKKKKNRCQNKVIATGVGRGQNRSQHA